MKNNQDQIPTENAMAYLGCEHPIAGSVEPRGTKTIKTRTNEGQYGKYALICVEMKV